MAVEPGDFEMAYQVLARKWRPRLFSEMVGQEHVVRALVNALDHDRLHHAYLFTGTRGVGKTTIARILAKALNCEAGVSSTPCGVCASCREIDEGRFVDLIEVDAASRTKVEDTRDLLDYTQYAPTRGRFKVYLIDEVHMLSKHSFNALLKTLEEPPPHMKFLLATTDPQRLPPTILSRCLQFHLKRLPAEIIAGHLSRVLEQEGIAAEDAAIARIARAADGSVRDSLSLLDQAIAYGGGRLQEGDVRTMLGSIDRSEVYDLLDALARGDGVAILEGVQRASEYTVEFSELLDELISVLQSVAIAQVVPQAAEGFPEEERARIAGLARAMGREDVQLYYQIAVLGRRDLPYVPEPRSGFEMIMLRMLAFRPADAGEAPLFRGDVSSKGLQRENPAPVGEAIPPISPVVKDSPLTPRPSSAPLPAVAAGKSDEDAWEALMASLDLQGMVKEMAANCVLLGRQGGAIRLMLDKAHSHLHSKSLEDRLREALRERLGCDVQLSIVIGEPSAPTPAARRRALEEARRQAAMTALEEDAGVRALRDVFGARIVAETVQPID
jgi:DNA polymerase-3 subunit gamma/tau